MSGQGSPVVKALPAYSTGVIDSVVQQLAWLQNPVVVARQLLAGVSNGMLLFLISAGLSLIFGVLRIINFAHGALFMFGAFIAVSVSAIAPGATGSFAAALLGAAAGLAVLGVALETGLLRRIYSARARIPAPAHLRPGLHPRRPGEAHLGPRGQLGRGADTARRQHARPWA